MTSVLTISWALESGISVVCVRGILYHMRGIEGVFPRDKGSLLPPLKTVSCTSNKLAFSTHHEEFKKELHIRRKKKVISFHVKMQILFTFCKTYKYNHYKNVHIPILSDITKMCHAQKT